MSEYRLEMRGVTKTFPGVRALDQAELKLRPGTVHALMGENGAGKSTLMKCMFGIYKMDAGEIYLDGEKIVISDPLHALKRGIAMVHQELQPIPERSVAENIFLGRYPMRRILGIPFVDHKTMNERTTKLLHEVQLQIDPKEHLGNLSVSQMQSVEIAKAISADCKVLILDEPTSSLTSHETEALFRIIASLKEKGVSIVYISHKMDEILRISDEVTIMRDGKYIGTWDAKELTIDMIITKMVGRNLENLYPPHKNKPGDVVLEVEDFSSIQPHSFQNVSFKLRQGEILGVGGLVGAQRTELVEALFGMRAHKSGGIRLNGARLNINRPEDAIGKKIALLTEDRRKTGIFGVLSIADNIAVASLRKYIKWGFWLDRKKIDGLVSENMGKLSIKAPSGKTLIQTLSGGNQQKVIFSRWLANDPDVLILDEPTRGIDVGAKYEIYTIISNLAEQGKSIIMISSEMGELIGMSDRIMVMCAGRVTGILSRDEATQESIMTLATQFSQEG
ncbi:MAG: sugar ABC transporter ATP-binding protein [Ruminococcaceae bacterium]|nr:sugar ABC transporter ATP-binding protein [Oscillospiraceae bacterium]